MSDDNNVEQQKPESKAAAEKDIDRIKELLETEGLTLAGAKRQLEEELGVKKSTAIHPDRMKKVLYSVREQLKDIASSLED